jgi:hypothetical protein
MSKIYGTYSPLKVLSCLVLIMRLRTPRPFALSTLHPVILKNYPPNPLPTSVEVNGVEPMTPCLQSRCSSQLSYTPKIILRSLIADL